MKLIHSVLLILSVYMIDLSVKAAEEPPHINLTRKQFAELQQYTDGKNYFLINASYESPKVYWHQRTDTNKDVHNFHELGVGYTKTSTKPDAPSLTITLSSDSNHPQRNLSSLSIFKAYLLFKHGLTDEPKKFTLVSTAQKLIDSNHAQFFAPDTSFFELNHYIFTDEKMKIHAIIRDPINSKTFLFKGDESYAEQFPVTWAQFSQSATQNMIVKFQAPFQSREIRSASQTKATMVNSVGGSTISSLKRYEGPIERIDQFYAVINDLSPGLYPNLKSHPCFEIHSPLHYVCNPKEAVASPPEELNKNATLAELERQGSCVFGKIDADGTKIDLFSNLKLGLASLKKDMEATPPGSARTPRLVVLSAEQNDPSQTTISPRGRSQSFSLITTSPRDKIDNAHNDSKALPRANSSPRGLLSSLDTDGALKHRGSEKALLHSASRKDVKVKEDEDIKHIEMRRPQTARDSKPREKSVTIVSPPTSARGEHAKESTPKSPRAAKPASATSVTPTRLKEKSEKHVSSSTPTLPKSPKDPRREKTQQLVSKSKAPEGKTPHREKDEPTRAKSSQGIKKTRIKSD